jgi:hypothetical protein
MLYENGSLVSNKQAGSSTECYETMIGPTNHTQLAVLPSI